MDEFDRDVQRMGSHDGAMDHIVAPAANRLASVKAVAGKVFGQFGTQPAVDGGGDHRVNASSLAVSTATAAWPRASPPSFGGTV